ncbi:MAG: potassium transporter [Gammaproteobacteria bacterium]|nr:potassium transporter [Gammaproteobacteria bacterium]
MQYAIVIKTLGLLLVLLSATFLPSLGVSWLSNDNHEMQFITSFLITGIAGVILWLPFRQLKTELRIRDGFLLATLFWTVLSLFSALPFLFSQELATHTFSEAVFEAVSGLTTTGSTVLAGIEYLPKSILYHRQQLHWIGGLGIIILAVAIFPMLGVGGLQLYRMEKPGPVESEKITPRIKETAQTLWYVYIGLTAVCALVYWALGMNLFDAVTHSFATIATGGFANYDASFAYFNNSLLELTAVFFMFCGATNFSLHFLVWRQKNVALFWKNSEFRTHLLILCMLILLTISGLWIFGLFDVTYAVRHGLFQAVSIMTNTGFTSTNFSVWPSFMPLLLILSTFIGGSTGSTAGGLKVLRVMMLFKQGVREVKRLIHPYGYFSIKIGTQAASARVMEGIWGFFSAYVFLFILMLILLVADGVDQVTAFSALSVCITNTGPGLGTVAAHFGDLSDFSTWVLSVAMILGRLEIFTILVLFTPYFWRK